jgi:bifunctional ADP-heptose synthase (sugar kinase/adenylyltransferase)
LEIIQPPERLNVLLIGETCLDKYVYGECNRLSPEAPVPILKYSETRTAPGMAHNVYHNLMAFDDVDVTFLTPPEVITKTRYVDSKYHHQILRVDDDIPITPFNGVIPEGLFDCIVISDYDKGFIDEAKLFQIVADARCPVFIDSKKVHLPIKYNCFIKINEAELEKLQTPIYAENAIITLGAAGATFNNELYPAEAVDVFDVCGAGDTFLAALVCTFLTTSSMEYAVAIANKAAAIAVSHFGTYILTKEDVNDIYL